MKWALDFCLYFVKGGERKKLAKHKTVEKTGIGFSHMMKRKRDGNTTNEWMFFQPTLSFNREDASQNVYKYITSQYLFWVQSARVKSSFWISFVGSRSDTNCITGSSRKARLVYVTESRRLSLALRWIIFDSMKIRRQPLDVHNIQHFCRLFLGQDSHCSHKRPTQLQYELIQARVSSHCGNSFRPQNFGCTASC